MSSSRIHPAARHPGAWIWLAFALPVGFTLPARAATFYVDNTNPRCTDAGTGSVKFPYCTISAAADQNHGPGITIAVVAGTYREQVTVPGSGDPGSPFVIEAINPGVTVDGAEDFAHAELWSHVSGDVWLAGAVTWAPRQVFSGGAALTATTLAPEATPAGTFQYIEGAGLYLNAGGGSPAGHGTLVGRYEYGITVWERSWVTIRGFTVTRAEERGILVSGSHDCEITGNRTTLNAKYGIQVAGGTRCLVARNVSWENGGHGIGLTAGSTGCIVEDNESHHNSDPIVRVANGLHVYGSPSNLIQRNRFHHNQDSGGHFQTGADNCISLQNCSWSNGDHGFDHFGATGTVHVGDVAHGNYRDGMSIEGNSTGTQVYNCILMENGLSTGGFDLWLEGASMAGFASNYNILWNAGAQPPVKINATVYRFVEDYAEDVGQDLESLQEDPRFASPAEGDFHLLPGSPAIDNASSAVPAWPSADASGTPRLDDPMAPNVGAGPIAFADRGAFEYPQHQTPPDAEPSTVDLSPAYPNPVAGPVSFRLELTEPAIIHWGIFDVQGREVWEEVRLSGAGTTDLWWDGNVRKGFPAGRGVYFARVRTDAQTFVRRFVRL